MMKKSTVFKICFAAGILFMILTIIFIFLSAFMKCYYGCSEYYYNKPYECESSYSGSSQCCSVGYSYCGEFPYCSPKSTKPCWTIFYISWISSGILLFLVVTVGIMFYNFWRRARDPRFNPGIIYAEKTYMKPFLPNENEPMYTYTNRN